MTARHMASSETLEIACLAGRAVLRFVGFITGT
jgi:hypothetical protein